jgi:hypothetical protein
MKKIYINPGLRAMQMDAEQMLAASGVTSNNGIGWGGVDIEGDEDPSVKEDSFDDDLFE